MFGRKEGDFEEVFSGGNGDYGAKDLVIIIQ